MQGLSQPSAGCAFQRLGGDGSRKRHLEDAVSLLQAEGVRPGYARRSLQSPQCVDQAMEAIDSPYTHLHRLSRGQQATRLMPSSSFEPRLLPGCTITQRQGSRHRISQGKSHFQSHRSGSQGQQRDR